MSGNQAVPKPGGRSKYTAEFKKDAVAMVIDEDRTIIDVCDLRKGRGLTLARLVESQNLLVALNADTVQNAFDTLVAAVMSLGEDIRPRALQNAYGIGARSDLLTTRREDFAMNEQRHADTIEAYENAMIDELVQILLNTEIQFDDDYSDLEQAPLSIYVYAHVRFNLTIVNGFLASMAFTDVDGRLTYENLKAGLERNYALGYVNGAPFINVHYQVVVVGSPIETFSSSQYKDHLTYSTQPRDHDTHGLPVELGIPLLITIIGVLSGRVIEFHWH